MNILLILEGNEEEALYEIAKNKGFANNLNVYAKNAEGCGNVPMLFQDYIANDFFDAIFCLYDVDKKLNIILRSIKQLRLGKAPNLFY